MNETLDDVVQKCWCLAMKLNYIVLSFRFTLATKLLVYKHFGRYSEMTVCAVSCKMFVLKVFLASVNPELSMNDQATSR